MAGHEDLSGGRKHLNDLGGAGLLALPAAGAFGDIHVGEIVVRHAYGAEGANPRTGAVPEAAVSAGLVAAAGEYRGPAVPDAFISEPLCGPGQAALAHDPRELRFHYLRFFPGYKRDGFSALRACRDAEARRHIRVIDLCLGMQLARGIAPAPVHRVQVNVLYLFHPRVYLDR